MKRNITRSSLDLIVRYRNASIAQGEHSLSRLICFGFNIFFRPEHSFYYPEIIKVEITTGCNMSCKFCGAATYDTITEGRSGQFMDLDTIKSIVQNTPTIRWIDLQGVGEPLLHPQFPEILKFLNSRGISCQFTTNGTLLSSELTESITEGNVHTVTVSISASSTEKYQALHGSPRYKEVIENIRLLINKRKQKRPKIRILAVVMSENLDELISLSSVAKKLGVDSLVVSAYKKIANQDPNEASHDELFKAVHALRAHAQTIGMPLEIEVPIIETPVCENGEGTSSAKCLWPWSSLAVNVNGDVIPCCYLMGNISFPLGNLANSSVYEIFNSSEYKKIRNKLNVGVSVNSLCYYCNDHVG